MRRRLLLPISLAAAVLLLPAPAAVAATPAISGVVTLGGTPRAGTPVAWFEPGSKAVTATRTDAQGRYRLPAPAAGTRYVLAVNVAEPITAPHAADVRFLPGYVGAAPADVPAAPLADPVLADGADRTVSVDVGRSTLLGGRTAAFANGTVRLLTLSGETAATAQANAQGAWSFRVAPGDYRVAAWGTDRWMPYVSAVVRVRGTSAVLTTSRPVRTSTLRGTVTSGGRPVRGAYVSFDGPDTSVVPIGDTVRTDRLGHWVRAGLAPGRYRVRVARASADADTASYVTAVRSRTLPPGDAGRLDVALVRGASVTATVETALGATAKRWTALLEDSKGTIVDSGQSPFRPKRLGDVVFRSLKPGAYVLRVLQGDRTLERTVRVAARATVRLGVLRPSTPALTLTGTAPAGAFVYLTRGPVSASATAGADGAFRVGGLLPGRYQVRTGVDGRGGETAVTVPAAGPVTLDAGAPADTDFRRISGTVLAGGVPVPGAVVELTDGYRFGVQDGRIEGAILTAGSYDVRSVLMGGPLFPRGTPYFLRWTAPRIVVQPGADTDLGTVSLTVTGGP